MSDLQGIQVYSDEFEAGAENEYLPGCIYTKESKKYILQTFERAINKISEIDSNFISATGPSIYNPTVAGNLRCFRICINYIGKAI